MLFSTKANEIIFICSADQQQPSKVHSDLGSWQRGQYDFHSVPTHATFSFLCYRAGQQDARQLTHAGLVAAADGGADLRANSQGTGFIVTNGGRHIILIF